MWKQVTVLLFWLWKRFLSPRCSRWSRSLVYKQSAIEVSFNVCSHSDIIIILQFGLIVFPKKELDFMCLLLSLHKFAFYGPPFYTHDESGLGSVFSLHYSLHHHLDQRFRRHDKHMCVYNIHTHICVFIRIFEIICAYDCAKRAYI